ncbi:ATP phosphoribosyltransferase [Hyphomonas sp.]|uniref:ATP phosphoribosyltransferase n=1 Tax=Hyphomonas sp. TaxID=87 RepID=UPI003342DC5B
MSRLTIAIPSKGRLKEQTEDWLVSLGHPLRQIGGERGYTAEIEGLDAEVRLLSAREIAQGLIEGSLHFGVTGEDLLNDLAPDGADDFRVVKRLGFGGADVVVAVPQAWFDVDSMADLEAAGAAFRKAHGRRLRVATKYLRLTRRFFAQKSVGEYRLVESAGATEAAPSTGTADVIVDITTTGATLKANGLKVLRDGVILESEAAFTQSARAEFGPVAKAAADALVGAFARSDHNF